jgi:polyhydroxybutyrate depolymerase
MVMLLGSGCAAPRRQEAASEAAPPVDLRKTISVNGIERSYLLHLPPGQDSAHPVPLLILLHSGGGKGDDLEKIFGMNGLADREGFAVVYPDGFSHHWNDGRNVERFRAHRQDIDDAGFIAALIDQLVESAGVDRHRVYAAGVAEGGMMAHRLACELADRIAAVAPVIAAMPESLAGGCFPARSIPVLMINGTDDAIVPWAGGEVRVGSRALGRVMSVSGTVSFWVSQNGCSNTPSITDEPDLDPDDGTRVRKQVYRRCAGSVEVVLYEVLGGGHAWPSGRNSALSGTAPAAGRSNRDADTAALMWEFFKNYRLERLPPTRRESAP